MIGSGIPAIAAGLVLGLLSILPDHSLAQNTAADGVATSSGRHPFRERWLSREKSPGKASTEGASGPRIDGPGDYSFTLVHDGLTRMYRVHVPPGYSPSKPAPMVLSFHGGGGNMDYQADDKYYGLISKSDQTGYIVVFPNGYSPVRSGKFASWNAGNCCAGARDKNIDDVGFVREMLKNLRSQLNVDPNRIFANGMSNGALFSYRLACEMSDTFKAIAAVAGSDVTKSCSPKVPISIMEIHAKDDDVVLFNGGAGRDTAMLTNFIPVSETVGRWVRRNSCNPTPKRVLEKEGAYCDLYSECRGGVEVKLCVTETGGHSWPGGRKVRTGEPGSTAISANDVMWEFFESRR